MGTAEKNNDLQSRRAKVYMGGGKSETDKQHSLNKLTARERISYLLDEGSFIEVDTFVSPKFTDDEKLGESVITGYGTIDERPVYVYAQDFTVIGGSLSQMHAKKICKIMDMALKTGAPVIALCDSLGARVEEGMPALAGLGEILARNAKLSGVVPQICAVMGPCAGGAAFTAGMSDFVFTVDGTTSMYLQGPSVISGVKGKTVKKEDVADAKFHSEVSGVSHFMATDDRNCLDMIKVLLSYLPSNNLEDAPILNTNDDINRMSDALINIVPDKGEYDVLSVISQIVDGGVFTEVQKDYAKNIVTGFARMNCQTVGIVANQPNFMDGELDSCASSKAARFIRFCDCFNIPLLTLTDSKGYVADDKEEQNAIIKNASKFVFAYAEATVPKVNVIIKRAYGTSYIAMSSKQVGADFVMAWPTAEISIMEPVNAVTFMSGEKLSNIKNPSQKRDDLADEYRKNVATPYVAAGLGYIDDIIDPDTTRPRVIAALEMLLSKRETRPSKKHSNLPM